MDDIIKAKLILQENVKEENEKLREENKNDNEKERELNEKMNVNTHKNLSIFDRARLKILKNHIKHNFNIKKIYTNNAVTNSPIKKRKTENEIFFTLPNNPIKNSSQNISLSNIDEEDENNYENFMNNKISDMKKEREEELLTVQKIRNEVIKNNKKSYINCLWLKNKKSKTPSLNILTSLFTDLNKISIKERKKLKAFEDKKEFKLPPILLHKLNQPIKNKQNIISNRTSNEKKNASIDLFSQVSTIVDEENNKINKTTEQGTQM